MDLEKQVIVTTEHRGVFYGTLIAYNETTKVAELSHAVMAIYWGTTRGLFELAANGPTNSSRISLPVARIRLEDCTAVIDCSSEAVETWKKYLK